MTSAAVRGSSAVIAPAALAVPRAPESVWDREQTTPLRSADECERLAGEVIGKLLETDDRGGSWRDAAVDRAYPPAPKEPPTDRELREEYAPEEALVSPTAAQEAWELLAGISFVKPDGRNLSLRRRNARSALEDVSGLYIGALRVAPQHLKDRAIYAAHDLLDHPPTIPAIASVLDCHISAVNKALARERERVRMRTWVLDPLWRNRKRLQAWNPHPAQTWTTWRGTEASTYVLRPARAAETEPAKRRTPEQAKAERREYLALFNKLDPHAPYYR